MNLSELGLKREGNEILTDVRINPVREFKAFLIESMARNTFYAGMRIQRTPRECVRGLKWLSRIRSRLPRLNERGSA